MKRMIFLLFILLLTLLNVSAGKHVTINGVQYETLTNNTASAKLTMKVKGDVVIQESVEIDGQSYTVILIEKAFVNARNKDVTSIVLPESVEAIRNGAFQGCKNLKRLVLPSGNFIIEQDAFADCNIISVEGNTEIYDSYKHNNGRDKNKDKRNDNKPKLSFIDAFITAKGTLMEHKKPLFSIFAKNELKKRIEFWQMKKVYETTEQFRNRVTAENRQKKMDEIVEDLKNEYIAKYAPQNVATTLGNYDSEYGIYIIQTTSYGKLFARVPKTDAAYFRQNYSKVEVIPHFNVVGDTLAIVSSQFKLDNKLYLSAVNYAVNTSDDYQFDLPPLDVNLALNGQKAQPAVAVDNTLDKDIPRTKQDNVKTFAFIIGNEKYQKAAPVPYAKNDARIFAEYCKLTLGMPDKNVKVYNDVTYGALIGAISDIQKIAKAFKGDINVVLYYAGHGIPDEATGDGYLLPVDADGMRMEACYPLSRLYKELGSLQTLSVTTFLDACFSGAQRGDGMVLAARSVAIKTKEEHPLGNTVVFTAATDKQTAYPYEEKGHGLFTYYLLKKLHDTKGNCTLGELGAYVCDEVAKQAVLSNGKEQTPTVLTSSGMADSWQDKKLK